MSLISLIVVDKLPWFQHRPSLCVVNFSERKKIVKNGMSTTPRA